MNDENKQIFFKTSPILSFQDLDITQNLHKNYNMGILKR